MPDAPPWIDGEKIPDERLEDIFRPPPGIQRRFYTSALVIGSRGVGKTTLFKHQKKIHNGVALHLFLQTEFSGLSSQTGLGPWSLEIPPLIESLIISKAVSLLALSVAIRFSAKRISVPVGELLDCLPSQFHNRTDGFDLSWLQDKRSAIASAPLDAFQGIYETRPLPKFVAAAGEICNQESGPLLLLLDKADMIMTPAVIPALELLDQSSHYIALVALRPCHSGSALGYLSSVPGDHYELIHLGTSPRSQSWLDFVESAVEAQIGSEFQTISKDVRNEILAISRDSPRTALDLIARYLSSPNAFAKEELRDRLEDMREMTMAGVHATLQKYHPNFRGMITRLRSEVIAEHGGITGPVILSIKQSGEKNLLERQSSFDRFVELALRCNAMYMPEGHLWVPGLQPSDLEIPPLFLWQRKEPMWSPLTARPVELSRSDKELLKTGGRKKIRHFEDMPSIFVAYRVNEDQSKKFKRDFEKAVRAHPYLSRFRVSDGHVPTSASWPKEIRRRIGKAKAVVADLEGMSKEVLFELGFAYGLKKVVFPTIAASSKLSQVPRWLGEAQLARYGTEAGIKGLLSHMESVLLYPKFERPFEIAQAVTSLAVWLRRMDWNNHACDQFRDVVTRAGLKVEVLADAVDETTISRAATASLLVVSLDGTESDALVHFVCGAVAAQPRAGSGKTFSRAVLVMEEPTQPEHSLIAESLSRFRQLVRLTKPQQIRQETVAFAESYKTWSKELRADRPKASYRDRRRY